MSSSTFLIREERALKYTTFPILLLAHTPQLTGFVDFLAAVEGLQVAVAAIASFRVNHGDLLTAVESFRVVVSAVAFQSSLVLVEFLNQGESMPSF